MFVFVCVCAWVRACTSEGWCFQRKHGQVSVTVLLWCDKLWYNNNDNHSQLIMRTRAHITHHKHWQTLSITQHSSCQLLGVQLWRSSKHTFNWISNLLRVQLHLCVCVCVRLCVNACQCLILVIAAGSNHLWAVNIMMESSESALTLQQTWRRKWKAVLGSANFTAEAVPAKAFWGP